jgi:hypothetical protein
VSNLHKMMVIIKTMGINTAKKYVVKMSIVIPRDEMANLKSIELCCTVYFKFKEEAKKIIQERSICGTILHNVL